MSNKGKTVVCNDRGGCVQGRYNPTDAGTAHQRLAAAAGITPYAAGSIKTDGSIGLNSESVNRANFGRCDLAGTRPGNYVASQIKNGNVMTVKEYKSKH